MSGINTNLHITRTQAMTMLNAVRFQTTWDTSGESRDELGAAEQMLLAALERLRDLEARRAYR